jgi:CheY-like chemotaxis protein
VIALEPNQPVYRILIVDDVLSNRQLLLQMLKPLGLELREAKNGKEAVAIWKQWQPHLIWMDMRMPTMTGYDAAREIRKLEEQGVKRSSRSGTVNEQQINRTPIIALTASVFEEQTEEMRAAGCDDFVRKPFREAKIFEKMNRHLGIRFVYEKTLKSEKPERWEQNVLTADAIADLPVEWKTEMKQAIESFDHDQMVALIGKIQSQHQDLANALRQWIDVYEYYKIMELL